MLHKKKYDMKLAELILYGYIKFEDRKFKISNWFFEQWLNGVEIKEENYQTSDTSPSTPTIFKKIAEYFKDTTNKLVFIILLSILILLFSILFDKKFGFDFLNGLNNCNLKLIKL